MKKIRGLIIVFCSTVLMTSALFAKGAGSSGGLTLLAAPGARPAALAGAFTSATNDITAMAYNPASLRTLQTKQASYMYQRGLADDSFNTLLFGLPLENATWGFSLNNYNGGKVSLYDGSTTQSVTAKSDLVLTAGYARLFGGVAVGVNGKFISSTLAERTNANAVALDFGGDYALNDRLKFGASLLNLGTPLKYIQANTPLPRVLRTGVSYVALPGRYHTSVLFDLPYYFNEQELRPALGLETLVGPMALRAGYQTGSDLEAFTLGMGFNVGRLSVDYSLGLVDTLNNRQMISLSMRFGGEETVDTKTEVPLTDQPAMTFSQNSRTGDKTRVYVVKKGDTLEKIAYMAYGNRLLWKKIYFANLNTIKNSSQTELVGKKLIIP